MLRRVAAVVQGGGIVIPQLMYHLDYVRRPRGTQHLVATQTVNAGKTTAAVRWYELRTRRNLSVGAQRHLRAGTTDSRFMSSAASDNSGELAIAYSITSSTNLSVAQVHGAPARRPCRLDVDRRNLAACRVVVADRLQQWGDYSSLSLDPIDLCTFWVHGVNTSAPPRVGTGARGSARSTSRRVRREARRRLS